MQLHYTTSYFALSYGFMDISASLGTVIAQGNARLIFSARDGNLLNSVSLGAAPAQVMGDITWSAQFGPDFALQMAGSTQRLFNMSAFNADLRMNTLAANGAPSGALIVPAAAPLTDVISMQVLEFGSGDLAALAHRAAPGLGLYALTDSGALTQIGQIFDGAKTYLDGVSDTAVLQRGADRLLLAISPLENGISSFLIAADGSVEWIDSLGAQNGLPVNGLSMMQTAAIGGVDFVILAATQSSSLTVLRVNDIGVFFQTDSVIDTLDTRFRDIAAFDTFVSDGRLFIVAAGSDAGISLFELLPNGRLSHMETFVLEGGQGLQTVTAIAAVVTGTDVQILMVDAGADRILHYDLSIDTLGGRFTAALGTATGDGLDNLLWGSASADALNGAGGDDFLFDGAGVDYLTGGAGADTFVFAKDGSNDYITDFAQGSDRIDISDWGRIYSTAALSITTTATGARIIYGDENIFITSASGAGITLTDADFFF